MIARSISLPLPLRQIFAGRLLGDFVRRLGGDVEFFMPAIDQQVAIAHAGVELEARRMSRSRASSRDEPLRLGVGDPAGGVVLHDAVDDGDEIAAEDPVGRRERNALGRRFERRPAGVILLRVVAQQAHGRDVAAGSRSPAGIVRTSPMRPSMAMRSMLGVSAASSGVLPPSSASGSSAAPSGMMIEQYVVQGVEHYVLLDHHPRRSGRRAAERTRRQDPARSGQASRTWTASPPKADSGTGPHGSAGVRERQRRGDHVPARLRPGEYHTGRAPLEAAAQRIPLSPTDWVFRCNLVTVIDGIMKDHSAGGITDAEAQTADHGSGDGDRQDLPGIRVSLRRELSQPAGLSRRSRSSMSTTKPPHEIPEEPAARYLPRGQGQRRCCSEIMDRSASSSLPSITRSTWCARETGDEPGDAGLALGPGACADHAEVRRAVRRSLAGCMITGVDLLRGLAVLLGWDINEVAGMTSFHDTNYAGQGEATAAMLDKYDLVFSHVEAAGRGLPPGGLEDEDRLRSSTSTAHRRARPGRSCGRSPNGASWSCRTTRPRSATANTATPPRSSP